MATPAELNAALDALTQEVSETATVEDSAIALIGGLRTELANALANATPQEVVDRVTALVAALDERQAVLGAAVATPPAPPAE